MDEREQDKDDKTEEATEERRRQFREEGKLPNPKELLSAFSLIGFSIIATLFGSNLFASLSSTFAQSWRLIPQVLHNPTTIQEQIYAAFRPVLPTFIVAGLVMLAAPIVIGLLITRFNWSWKKMELKLEKLNPVSGLKNIFGQNLIVETLKNSAKAILIGSVTALFLKDEIFKSISFIGTSVHGTFHTIGHTTLFLLVFVCMATVVIGAGDFAWNFYKNEQELRMTKQQVKQEVKTQEGDPFIKGARKRIAREMLFSASVERVPNATFVVTNPTHYSVAIQYQQGMEVPIVVSKGQDYLALKIREVAKKHDIILIENKPLARALYKQVDIGGEVPRTLFSAVIEVMKTIYAQRGRGYFEKFGLAGHFG